jgi:hypothetical protein
MSTEKNGHYCNYCPGPRGPGRGSREIGSDEITEGFVDEGNVRSKVLKHTVYEALGRREQLRAQLSSWLLPTVTSC